MFRRVAFSLIVILLIGAGGFAAFAWHRAIAPSGAPMASAFAPALVARGAMLAAGGDCANCHTARGGPAYAGGDAIQTGFGAIYASNITPDVADGIGGWTEPAFARAMRDGVARDGSHLFPAFPYTHFTKMTDADVSALYAYFMTQAPVRQPSRGNALPFPLNVRALQAGWKLLFFRAGRYVEQPAQSAAWNRGAYLAEGLAHCGACHTPRNALGAERAGAAYAGSVLDGRPVPALTQANTAPVPWNQDELYAYLRTGISRFHGQPAGPMRQVVQNGLKYLPDSDIQALAVYFAAIGHTAARGGEMQAAILRANAAPAHDVLQPQNAGARLYVTACAACHYNAAGASLKARPNLAFASVINAPEPDALVGTILKGRGAVMPGFGTGLSDADIALIAAHLRASRTGSPPWANLVQKVAAIRARPSPPPSAAP